MSLKLARRGRMVIGRIDRRSRFRASTHEMTMRNDDQADAEQRVELSLADLAIVCGGQQVDTLEADFAKWAKEFYAPWANLRFVESPAPVQAAPE